MTPKTRTNPRDRTARLRVLAAAQRGVVSRGQLHKLGFTDDAIKAAVRSGRLHRVFRGVYAVGRSEVGPRGRMWAAVLACGPGAVVSHRSAAYLLGLVDRPPVVVDVIAPGQRGRKIDGIKRHQVPAPLASQAGAVDGIPCTSPARTLVDLAGVVSARTLKSAFERAAARKLLDVSAVEAASRPGARGAAALRAEVDRWRRAAPLARRSKLKSPLEAMVLPLLARRDFPPPRANAPVDLAGGAHIEVDFLWPAQRFVLEADSRDFHGTEVAFERDRWRDRELMRAGYSTLRVTRLQAETEPQAVAEAIAARLSSVPQVGHPSQPGPR